MKTKSKNKINVVALFVPICILVVVHRIMYQKYKNYWQKPRGCSPSSLFVSRAKRVEKCTSSTRGTYGTKRM
jgi:Tfp pilus assembly protein PilE